MPSARAIFGLLLVALLVGSAEADSIDAGKFPSWPQFRGPNSDNLSPETGLLQRWPKRGPKLLWTAKGLGGGFSSVTIAGGHIYTCGNVEGQTTVTALNLEGETIWRVSVGEAWERSHPGSRSTPTIDAGRLFVEAPLGDVVCLDAETGKEIWRLNILKKFHAKNIVWGLAESLLVDGEHVICGPGGAETAVVALDKKTGQIAWKSASADGDPAGYATPLLISSGGLRILLGMTGKALIGVNADSGELLFRHEHITNYDVNAATPLYRDGRIFISSGYGSGSEMLKLTVDGQKASVARLWQNKDLDNHHGGVILLDGYIYGAAFKGKWVCLDWDSGKTMYAEPGVGKGALTYADGMLYTLSENGKMGLVRAKPERHEVDSQFAIPKGGTGPSWAYPVVCGGRLYIRHGDFLYAYDIRKE